MPLSTKLDSGQQVEIITSETETCQVSWAAFVTTSKARSAVRSYLTKHFPKEMEEIAKKLEKEQKTSKTQQLLGWLHLSKPKAKKEKPRTEVFKPKVSSTTLELSGIDGRGLLNTITKVIADNCTANITNIQLNCHDGLFDGSITLDTNDSKAVSRLCAALKKIHEVEKAARQ